MYVLGCEGLFLYVCQQREVSNLFAALCPRLSGSDLYFFVPACEVSEVFRVYVPGFESLVSLWV